MTSLWGRLLPPLGSVALLLLLVGSSGSSSPHSMRYFYTGVSEPGSGLPQFISVGYVDDQPISRYDSITKKAAPQVPWMEKVVEDEADFWQRETQNFQVSESVFRVGLVTLRDRFHQKNGTGLHTWQWMYGCEVGPDGRLIGGHDQHAYDGEDFLALDRHTLTWTARVPQAQETKRRWEGEIQWAQHTNAYLEETCVEWLQKYLGYGQETLLRTEAPMPRVARKGYDGQETLFCQLYGFYPKEIEVTWMKDGKDQKPETYSGGVIPNSDGTYHTWLSIEVDPKERDRYRCRVGHDSLPEPLDLAWEEPGPSWGLIVGVLVGVTLAALALGAGVALYWKRRSRLESGYNGTPVPVTET